MAARGQDRAAGRPARSGRLRARLAAVAPSALRAPIRLLAGSWAVGLIAAVLAHEIRYTGAGTIGWPLIWSTPLLPYRALGLPLNPGVAFGVGLTLSLAFIAATVVATYLLGRAASGRVWIGVGASLLYAFWPVLVLLLAGIRGTMNGTWQIDVGLSQYTEPISTALACVALVLVIRRGAGPLSAVAAGALLGFDVAVRLSNALILGIVLVWLLLRDRDRGRAVWAAVGAAAFAPVVLAFWRQGYFNPAPDANASGSGSGVIPAHTFALHNAHLAWSHSLLWRPAQLLVLVPLAVVGAFAVRRSVALLLGAAILATAAFYTFYFATPIHPRFLFVVLPPLLVLWVAGLSAGRGQGPHDRRARVKVLLVALYFPPAGGGGVQRPLKFATHLPELGIETHVLAPDDPKWIHRDDELQPPTLAWVHRVRYVGPKGRRPAEELHGTTGLERFSKQAQLAGRRLLVPDENVSWNLTAIPAAIRIVRNEQIDVVITTSPPNSVHLIGAAVQKATGVKWVADLRDSVAAHPHRRAESMLVRAKESGDHLVARLVAKRADAVIAVSEAIAAEVNERSPTGPVVTIANGSDFDDFVGIERRPSERFRITHTGSFFGKRDPRPFLSAFAASGLDDAIVRFLGDFRSSDREWAAELALGDRLEVIPYAPRRKSLELQRDSEVLLLLIPEAGGRGKGVLSGKVFEYLAAERPILALVPPDGAAADLIRKADAGVVVAPDDVDGIAAALRELHTRWRSGGLEAAPLAPEWKARVSRRARVQELADLLERLT